jgi:CubicO group peptidase (beta-lactamase class C family)
MKYLAVGIMALICLGCHGRIYEDHVKSKDQILSGIGRLEDYVQGKMKEYDVEKVSMAIICDNAVIYAHAFNAQLNEQFQAASISKPVSAYAALRLVEQGKLELDKPLSSYLHERYFPEGSEGNAITLRMVLSHTSGLSNNVSGKDRIVHYKPGEAFHYSGGGFTYLTKVIEEVTGTPFAAYMQQNVLSPLGMSDSSFSIGAGGYNRISAASGLASTPVDLARFFLEILNPRMIDLDLIRQMLSESVRINSHYSWGLGIGLQRGKGEDAIWHWGNNNDTYESLVVIFVKSNTGIIIMTKGKNGKKIYQDIAHSAIGGSYYGLERNLGFR